MRNKPVTSRLVALRKKNEELQHRLAEAEETLRAIREGHVDAIVVSGKDGRHRIFSLTGSDHVYRLIVETMKEAALTVALDGTVLFCNRQFGQFLGLPQQDILGHSLTEFVDLVQTSSITKMLTRSLAESVKQRIVFQSEGHPPIPAHISANVLNQPDGVSVCIVATDLSELEASTEMLQQLRRHQEALLKSESRLRAVFAASQDAIVIADDSRRYVETNPAAATLLGMREHERVNKRFSDFVDPRHDFDRIWAEFRKTGCYKGELHLRRPDGTVWLAEVFAVADISPGQHLAVLRDITARKRAEEALREMNRTLEQRVAERTAEAEQRATDLRALAAELTRTEQREQRRLAQWLHDDLQQVLVATKMQIALIQHAVTEPRLRQLLQKASQLVDESIGQSRSLTAELTPPIVYESGLAPGLQHLARWIEEKHRLHVTVETSTDVKPENQEAAVILFSAARELLFNVVKHAGVSEARVSLAEKEGRIWLSVEDQGAGFDPALSQEERSGFGLFSIGERLRSIGGELQIRSAPGRGTCMILSVPTGATLTSFEPKQAETGWTLSVTPRAAQPSSLQKGESGVTIRVLLVDDHQMVREGLAGLLAQDKSVSVIGQASDGCEAVQLAEQLRPDVVIMDISMPGMNGIQATSRIKAVLPDIRVIGLSMHDDKEHRTAMSQAGADTYLNKGGPAEELMATIRMVTMRRHHKAQSTRAEGRAM